MDLSFEEILQAIDGEVLEKNTTVFNKICIDTRKIEKDNIYFALKGENFNGNKFVVEAFNKGASIAIVDEIFYNDKEINGTIIKVKNTEKALLELAKYYRRKLGLKVIGVTGSCGKTSTKDLIAALLSEKYKVFKTKGNFNNQIGLPLMVFELDKSIDVAVLEMGMSDLGEIDVLAECARPDIAVITNIGLSHIENLKTQDNILKAKSEIYNYFNEDNSLIINAEDKLLSKIKNKCFEIIKIGYNHEYDINAYNIILREDSSSFNINENGKEYTFNLPMPGKHNILNCMLAIAVSKKLNVTIDEMIKGINNLEATSMRLEIIKNKNNIIINDCYNASPDSMKSSLDVLNTYKDKRKVAILGTMNELGDESIRAHKEVGEYAKDRVDLLIAIGKYKNEYKDGYSKENIITYETKEDFIKEKETIIKENDIILVKASRGIRFEEIVNSLEDKNI